MEPVFMVLGESAGVAAAQALAGETAVRKIDVARLQARLREAGQALAWPPTSTRQFVLLIITSARIPVWR